MAQTSLFGEPARFAGGLQDLGGGAFAWLQPNGKLGESNAGLLVGDGASLVVDTLWDVKLTRRMLGAFKAPTEDAPIEVLVNTHSDGDHWWGNELLAGQRIVTSDAAARIMAGEKVSEIRSLLKLGSAVDLAGKLPVAPKRDALKAVGAYFTAIGRPYDWSDIHLTQPTETFSGETTLTVGGRDAELIEVGPAHTPGDLVVIARDAGVCFAADILFVGVHPVMWAGPVENWIAALERLDGLDGVGTFVPGHGPVCGRDEVATLRAYWEWLLTEGRARHAAGRSPVEAARELCARPDGALWSQPWADWDSPERMIVNLTTMFGAWDDNGPPEGPRAMVGLFREMALLHRDLTGDGSGQAKRAYQ